MKNVKKIWRSLFAGLGARDTGNGLVRMFEVEYANEARLMKKMNGFITPMMVEAHLEQLRKR